MKIATLLLGFVCATSLAVADDAAKAKAEDDIREATFRHQFLHNASGVQQKAKVYFLAVGRNEDWDDGSDGFMALDGADPSDEFLKRFADHKPVVKKKSQGVVHLGEFKDKKTGEKGLVFGLGTIKWVSDTEVEITGGYYEAGLSASGNTYFLKKEKGKWTVTKEVRHWIS